jgi:hypothetical protein
MRDHFCDKKSRSRILPQLFFLRAALRFAL